MTNAFAKFDVSMSVKEMHLQKSTVFDLDLGVKVTHDVAQYPLHHVTYAYAKFEVATSNGLGGECIYKEICYLSFDLDLWVTQKCSSACDICTCIV